MKLFGLYITRASTHEKEQAGHKAVIKKVLKKRAQDNSLWDKIMSRLLWENHNLRMVRR